MGRCPHSCRADGSPYSLADIDGDKRKELITVPIVGEGAKMPATAGRPVRLMCHQIPRDPVHDAWSRPVFDESLTVVHGCVFSMGWRRARWNS